MQTLKQLMQTLWTSMRPGKRVIVGFSSGTSQQDVLLIKRLIEEGAIKPVVDRTYEVQDVVEAHRYVDTGRKRGGVVLSLKDYGGTRRRAEKRELCVQHAPEAQAGPRATSGLKKRKRALTPPSAVAGAGIVACHAHDARRA